MMPLPVVELRLALACAMVATAAPQERPLFRSLANGDFDTYWILSIDKDGASATGDEGSVDRVGARSCGDRPARPSDDVEEAGSAAAGRERSPPAVATTAAVALDRNVRRSTASWIELPGAIGMDRLAPGTSASRSSLPAPRGALRNGCVGSTAHTMPIPGDVPIGRTGPGSGTKGFCRP